MQHSDFSSESAAHDRIRNKVDYHEFLHADLKAHGLQTWHWYLRYRHPELHFQRILRKVEYLSLASNQWHQIPYVFNRLRLANLSVRTGISIPPGVFGRGLSIAHYGSIVVNDSARVGSYCRIHSATNIGVGEGGAPRIGDFVYIGPGAVVSGGISIGKETAIGANAVVLRDLPEKCIAAGVPASVKSTRSSYEAMPEAIQAIMSAHAH